MGEKKKLKCKFFGLPFNESNSPMPKITEPEVFSKQPYDPGIYILGIRNWIQFEMDFIAHKHHKLSKHNIK